MKTLPCVLVLLCFLCDAEAQQKFSTNKGVISFVSKAQLELIQATSGQMQGILDPATNQFAFLVDIKSFQGFNSSLQRQHFNDNYMESEKFPVAKFSGKIIEQVEFTKDNTVEVRAKGELDIHGQKQVRIIKGKITVKGNVVTIEAQFQVPLSDHNITIPKIVNQKIATEINVDISATLSREQ